MPKIKFVLVAVLFLTMTWPVNAKTIYEKDTTLQSQEFDHTGIEVFETSQIRIVGSGHPNISLMVFENENYTAWINQQEFTLLFSNTTNDNFDYLLTNFINDESKTIDIVFLNTDQVERIVNFRIVSIESTAQEVTMGILITLGVILTMGISGKKRGKQLFE